MKNKRLISVTIFCLLVCFADFKPLLALDFQDSTTLRKHKNQLGFVFKLDNRFSFAGNQSVTIYGFRTGIKLKDKHEFGVALNWIGSRNFFEFPARPVNGELNPTAVVAPRGRLLYGYAGVFYEYNFYQKKRWSFSIPLQLGTGKAGMAMESQEGEFIERRLNSFILFEPSVNIDYKVVRFAGIGAGVGYRFAQSEQSIVQHSLTKPVFILKVKIYLSEIFRSVRKKDYRFFYFE